MHWIAALVAAAPLPAANLPQASVEVDLTGVRSDRGMIHACLTQSPHHFPDCAKDPAGLKLSVPASARQLRFSGIPPGRYALSVFHDENSNHRLDTFLHIPREGFGFSRNPVVRFGAPRFDQVGIDLAPGFTRASVRMKYLL